MRYKTKEYHMNYKKNRKIMVEAVNSGCRTMAELALYLRIRVQISSISIEQ